MPISTRALTPVALLVAAGLAAVACSSSPFGPFLVQNAREIQPPPVWFEWYQETAACIGTDATFTNVTWYRADAIVNRDSRNEHRGLFRPPHDIFLVDGKSASEHAVRHEMVHEILQVDDPSHTHEDPAFERCVGDLINEKNGS